MSKQADQSRAFFRGIKKGKPAPIYYVYGAESYLLDLAVQTIIEAAAPDGLNDFNYDAFHGKSATGDAVRSAVEMLPMMSPRRIVVLRDLQEMPLSELAALEDYFTNPSPSTCLIVHAFTAQKSIDGRSAVAKKLKKAAESCEFKTLYESDLGTFIQKQANSLKIRLTPAAEAYLIEAVGTDLALLHSALEKVDLYVGAAPDGTVRTVDIDDVEAIIAQTRVRSIFDLTDALGNREYEQAIKILDRMLLSGEPPLRITHMITRHFRVLAKLHDPSLRGADNRTLGPAVGVAPFFVRDYQRHARKFSLPEVYTVLTSMLDVDIALKSSKLPDRTALEGLLYGICFRAPVEAAIS